MLEVRSAELSGERLNQGSDQGSDRGSGTGGNVASLDRDLFQDYAEKFMDDLFGDVEHLLKVSPINKSREQSSNGNGFSLINLANFSQKPGSTNGFSQNYANQNFAPQNSAPRTDQGTTRSEFGSESGFGMVAGKLQVIPKSANPTSSTLTLSKIDLPALVIPEIDSHDLLWLAPADELPPAPPTVVIPDSAPAKDGQSHTWGFLDRFLLFTACLSICSTLALWVINSGIINSRFTGLISASNPAPIAETVGDRNSSDRPDTINLAQKVRQSLASLNSKKVTSNLAPQPVLPPNSSVVAPNPNPFVVPVQPIYVPLYQPPVAMPPLNLPQNSSKSLPVIQPKSAAPIQTPAPVLSAPPLVAKPAPVVAAKPLAPTPKLAPKLANVPSPVAMLTPDPNKYKLVGILAFGEQSSAMVEINGAFQSIKLGSAIANSGWVLSGLNQQEAILKRGSEVKSVTVGQKF